MNLDPLRTLLRGKVQERALLFLTQGKTHHSPLYKVPPHHHQYPLGTIREVTRAGIRYRLDLSSAQPLSGLAFAQCLYPGAGEFSAP